MAAKKASTRSKTQGKRAPKAEGRRRSADDSTVSVSRETLRQLMLRLRDAQHAVVRAPNREIPQRGYGPLAALQAYDGIQQVVQSIDDLLAVQS